jgi:hypothetical protein
LTTKQATLAPWVMMFRVCRAGIDPNQGLPAEKASLASGGTLGGRKRGHDGIAIGRAPARSRAGGAQVIVVRCVRAANGARSVVQSLKSIRRSTTMLPLSFLTML